MVVVLDDAVLWQPDADAGERDADAEAHAASGADVADDLGPEPWAPPDPAAEPQPDAPERAHCRVHGVPPLIPAQHPLYDHRRLYRRHRDLRQRQRQRDLNSKGKDNPGIKRRTSLVPAVERKARNGTGLRWAFAAVQATGFGSVFGGGSGDWWIWWGSGISSVGCCVEEDSGLVSNFGSLKPGTTSQFQRSYPQI